MRHLSICKFFEVVSALIRAVFLPPHRTDPIIDLVEVRYARHGFGVEVGVGTC